MLAFEGPDLPAWRWRIGWRPRRPRGASSGTRTSPRRAGPSLTDALQARGPDGRRCWLRPIRRAASSWPSATAPRSPATWRSARPVTALAERVARAIGTELRAVGVNVNYAPVCDLATNPDNPGLGARSFGDDPAGRRRTRRGDRARAQAAGVAATAKHFPGKGDVGVDTHHELGGVPHDPARVEAVELAPFRAAFEAGARLVMSGHFALPALTGDPSLPATVSSAVMDHLLRDDLGFGGVAISDALDMKALSAGADPGRGGDRGCPGGRGPAPVLPGPCEPRAGRRGAPARRPPRAVRPPLWREPRADPGPSRVGGTGYATGTRHRGSSEHQSLARSWRSERSPSFGTMRASFRCGSPRMRGRRGHAAEPRNLTPADSSESVEPRGWRVRAAPPAVIGRGDRDGPSSVGGGYRGRARGGRRDADWWSSGRSAWSDAAQAELVEALLGTGVPLVTVALRCRSTSPDYPSAATHLCTYSILPPSLDALVAGLMGDIPLSGRLPAAVHGLHPPGHGLAPRPEADRWACATRSSSSRRSSSACSRRERVPMASWPTAPPAGRSTRSSSRRAGRRITPPSTPSTSSGPRRPARRPGHPVGPLAVRRRARFRRALVVGISQSGASPDMVGIVEAGRDQGVPAAGHHERPGVRPGRRRRPRRRPGRRPRAGGGRDKTYTAELVAVAMLSAAMAETGPDPAPTLARLPAALATPCSGPRTPSGSRATRPSPMRGARARLRVRHRPRVGAEAPGAAPGARGALLGRGLPARPDRPDRGRLPRRSRWSPGARSRRTC